MRSSSPKTSLWTTESIIDFTHNRRVLASTFMSRRYKTVYLIRDILFWNSLIFNILQRPTLSRKADPVWSNPCLGTTMQEAIGSVRPMRAETFGCGASAASLNDEAGLYTECKCNSDWPASNGMNFWDNTALLCRGPNINPYFYRWSVRQQNTEHI